MENSGILKELVILLTVSIPISFVSQKIKLPSLIGYMITGIIIGPGLLKLIPDASRVEVLADIGIILLLFSIGLEFSAARITNIKKFFIFGGILQVMGTIMAVTGLSYLFTGNLPQSLFIGFLISLSSTAIVLKSYIDRGEADTPYGNISIGILLFQDLCVIPMMIITPYLIKNETFSFLPFLKTILFAVIGLIIIYTAARILYKFIIDQIAKLNNRELFTISIVAISIGTAYLTSSFGLSLAIGAFLAGFILSKSDYSHQIVADILPFRDCFNSIFFISIGMLLNIHLILDHIFIILGITVLIILIKFIIILPIPLFFKYSLRIAVIIGFGLAQVSEFSFILGNLGLKLNIISKEIFQYFIAISILTMITSPFLIHIAPSFGLFVQRLFGIPLKNNETFKEKELDLKNHVIICGYGLNGQNLAHVLKEVGIKYIIADINAQKIKQLQKENESIIFGDVTKPEIIKKMGISTARVAVIAISDPVAARHTLKTIKSLNPKIYVLVRTRYLSEINDLQKLGANQVIPQEFETSIEIFSRVLNQYHVPKNVIRQEVEIIRKEGYKMFRGISFEPSTLMDISDILNMTLTETLVIKETSKAVNKSISQLNLRKKSGATIIAVIREGKAHTNPKPDFKLDPNDVLVILGNHADLDKAMNYITELETV